MDQNVAAKITNRSYHKEYSYQSLLMLTLDINYPEIYLSNNPPVQMRINRYYRKTAEDFYIYATDDLLGGARKEYLDSIKNGFPFRPFDAVMNYTVTLNDNCLLSVYFDRYEFTGGAHGNTVRFSNTRNLLYGNTVQMKDLFARGEDYKGLVEHQILLLADKEAAKDPYIYFENYEELIVKYFNPESFYLSSRGLCVYYQQYEIGPYSSGIIVFEIPYESLGISKPGCEPDQIHTQ